MTDDLEEFQQAIEAWKLGGKKKGRRGPNVVSFEYDCWTCGWVGVVNAIKFPLTKKPRCWTCGERWSSLWEMHGALMCPACMNRHGGKRHWAEADRRVREGKNWKPPKSVLDGDDVQGELF